MYLLIALGAFICELIDAGLGMGYGTILSPLLIIFGFNPLIVIPSILFSQAMGGFMGATFHHEMKNMDLGHGKQDSKIVYVIAIGGILATIIAAIIAVKLPKNILTGYIGILVFIMGLLILFKRRNFKFSWKKIITLGIISAFNKGISGGGFGPVATGGQFISGNEYKNSIGITTLTEVPICITAFLTYMLTSGNADWKFIASLSAGAALAAPLGAFITKVISPKILRNIVGIIILIEGIFTLIKVLW